MKSLIANKNQAYNRTVIQIIITGKKAQVKHYNGLLDNLLIFST